MAKAKMATKADLKKMKAADVKQDKKMMAKVTKTAKKSKSK